MISSHLSILDDKNSDKTKSSCLKFLLTGQNEVGQHSDTRRVCVIWLRVKTFRNSFFNFLSSKPAYFINAKFSLFSFRHQGQLFWYAFLQIVWPCEIAARKEEHFRSWQLMLEICKLCCVGEVKLHKDVKTHWSLVPCEVDELQGIRMSCWKQNDLCFFNGLSLSSVETMSTSWLGYGWETILINREDDCHE